MIMGKTYVQEQAERQARADQWLASCDKPETVFVILIRLDDGRHAILQKVQRTTKLISRFSLETYVERGAWRNVGDAFAYFYAELPKCKTTPSGC